jgi:hypothetical protein
VVDEPAEATSQTPLSLELVRVSVVPEGAFSVVLIDGVPPGLVTLERTYATDELRPRGPQYVKIPAGHYVCRRTRFERGGYDTYEVTGVIGHDRLLFHRGNVEADSEGCILLGQRFGLVGGTAGVLESTIAFAVFMSLVGYRQSFELSVRAT